MDENIREEILQENKMGTMPVGRLLFSMAVPMMVSMLFQALYNVVDSIFVAKLSQDAMNAVSLAFPLQTLCIAFSGGTGVGMNALLSRSLGEKNQAGADRAANVGLFLTLCNFALFALIGWTLAGPFFRFQTDNPQIITYGRGYVTVCIGCSIGLFFQMYNERLLQSTGRTNLSMITQIAGAATNIVLDPILIFGLLGFPRLEVAGAAIATVIGQLVGASIGFYLNLTRNPDVHLRRREIRPHAATIKEIYAVGVPSIIMASISSVMVIGMNQILRRFSETAVAVFGVYFKLQSFVFMPVFGMNNGMVPIIAYNYGARRKQRIYGTMKLSVLYCVAIMVVGLILFETIPTPLLRLFDASATMLAIGIPALRIIAIHFPLAGFDIIMSSTFQALGNGVYSLIVSLARQLFVLVPVAYLLSLAGNINAVWFAFPIAELASITCCILFFRRIQKTKLNFE